MGWERCNEKILNRVWVKISVSSKTVYQKKNASERKIIAEVNASV